MKKNNTHILVLDKDDPKKELEFEVAFYLSLTEKQRYTIMKKLAKQTLETLKNNDYSKTPAIISRA